MTDAEVQTWWPDLGVVLTELRRIDRSASADLLVDAVRSGATSGEILGSIGAVLRDHRELRSRLSDSAAHAWDSVMADVQRAFPGSRLTQHLARLGRRINSPRARIP